MQNSVINVLIHVLTYADDRAMLMFIYHLVSALTYTITWHAYALRVYLGHSAGVSTVYTSACSRRQIFFTRKRFLLCVKHDVSWYPTCYVPHEFQYSYTQQQKRFPSTSTRYDVLVSSVSRAKVKPTKKGRTHADTPVR